MAIGLIWRLLFNVMAPQNSILDTEGRLMRSIDASTDVFMTEHSVNCVTCSSKFNWACSQLLWKFRLFKLLAVHWVFMQHCDVFKRREAFTQLQLTVTVILTCCLCNSKLTAFGKNEQSLLLRNESFVMSVTIQVGENSVSIFLRPFTRFVSPSIVLNRNYWSTEASTFSVFSTSMQGYMPRQYFVSILRLPYVMSRFIVHGQQRNRIKIDMY